MSRPRRDLRVFDDEAPLAERDLRAVDLAALGGAWTDADRILLEELLEDAGSELQRELLQRALLMGHTATELHAFADSIRGLADPELFAACAAPKAKGHDMATLLRAQADPLVAFELNGRAPAAPRRRAPPAPVKLPPLMMVDRAIAPVAPVARGKVAEEPPGAAPAPGEGRAPRRAGFADDLFTAAVEYAGIRFTEHAIDDDQVRLEDVVIAAAEALERGIPIPVVIGARAGDFRRYALLLQTQTSGRNRAFQLYDPFAPETVWANEGDLLSGNELPFSDKVFRRLTAIALPRLPPRGVGGIGSGFEGAR